jgi:hypothetical protein
MYKDVLIILVILFAIFLWAIQQSFPFSTLSSNILNRESSNSHGDDDL